MQRREFVKRSALAGMAAWTAVSYAQVPGANDRLRIGVIGCGGRGRFDARLMRGTPEDIQAHLRQFAAEDPCNSLILLAGAVSDAKM
jgi:anaerobic selenocysteine-containing dehydrogenase